MIEPEKRVRTAIHYSDIRRFKECRLAWDFSSPLRMNLETTTPNKNLWAGSGAHEALAAYYNPVNSPPSTSILMDAYEAWVELAKEDLKTSSDSLIEPVMSEIALVRQVLEHYAMWAPKNDKFKALAVEVRLEVPIPVFPGVYLFVEGTADIYAELPNLDTILVEHKTCRQFPNFDALFGDEQGLTYTWAAQTSKATRERPPSGILFNFLRKKAPSKPKLLQRGGVSKNKNIATTFAVYKSALEEVGEDPKLYQDILYHLWKQEQETDTHPFFRRAGPIRRSRRALQAYSSRLIETIADMVDPQIHIYPSPNWYRCGYCPFRIPCELYCAGVNPGPLLRNDFQRRQPRWPDVDQEDI